MLIRRYILVLSLYCFALSLAAQDSLYIVGSIELSGNKRTRDYVVIRELDFKPGDTISAQSLAARLEKNRNLIFNTRLFNKVDILYFLKEDTLSFTILLIERWYVWPVPMIRFADRNVNVWLENRDPDRLNYGMYIQDYNFRGRGEILKLSLFQGYTHQYGIDYQVPYVNRRKTIGLQFSAGYSSNREIWYATRNNEVQFYYHSAGPAIKRESAMATLIYRPLYYTKHYFTVSYLKVHVLDTILTPEMNPVYTLGARKIQTNPSAHYSFIYDRRDIAFYPLRGHFLQADAELNYFTQSGTTNTGLSLNLEKFWALGGRHYFALGWRMRGMAGQEFPYPSIRGLGYQHVIRGFEPFVIDGPNYTVIKSNYKIELFRREFNLKRLRRSEFNYVPLAVYFNLYSDAGYAQNNSDPASGNTYENRWLSGHGLGIDFVTFYDRVLRIEYSMNNFGFGRIYLNFTAPI